MPRYAPALGIHKSNCKFIASTKFTNIYVNNLRKKTTKFSNTIYRFQMC